jgi:hypothetical protein
MDQLDAGQAGAEPGAEAGLPGAGGAPAAIPGSAVPAAGAATPTTA